MSVIHRSWHGLDVSGEVEAGFYRLDRDGGAHPLRRSPTPGLVTSPGCACEVAGTRRLAPPTRLRTITEGHEEEVRVVGIGVRTVVDLEVSPGHVPLVDEDRIRSARPASGWQRFNVGTVDCIEVGERQYQEFGSRVRASGSILCSLLPFDELMARHVAGLQIPNAILALTTGDGRLVGARGYTNLSFYDGVSEKYAQHRVSYPDWYDGIHPFLAEPETEFRVGGITKSLTAFTIYRMAQDGLLSLDERVFQGPWADKWEATIVRRYGSQNTYYRRGFFDRVNDITEGRLYQVRVRHLMNHTANWVQRVGSGDEVASGNHALTDLDLHKMDRKVAQYLAIGLPVDDIDILAFAVGERGLLQPNNLYWWGRSDFEPGKRVPTGTADTYSNFGYNLLGMIASVAIDRVSPRDKRAVLRHYAFRELRMAGDGGYGLSGAGHRRLREAPYYSKQRWSQTVLTGHVTDYALHMQSDGDIRYRTSLESPLIRAPYGYRNLLNNSSSGAAVLNAFGLGRLMAKIASRDFLPNLDSRIEYLYPRPEDYYNSALENLDGGDIYRVARSDLAGEGHTRTLGGLDWGGGFVGHTGSLEETAAAFSVNSELHTTIGARGMGVAYSCNKEDGDWEACADSVNGEYGARLAHDRPSLVRVLSSLWTREAGGFDDSLWVKAGNSSVDLFRNG